MLADAEGAVERLKHGILTVDPRETKRDLRSQFADYLAELDRRGRDAMYRYNVGKHLAAAADHQGWACIRDITPRGISAFLQSLARRKLSGKTVNDYRGDLSAFFEWAVLNHLAPSNPCLAVPKTDYKADKKRRALSHAECCALLSAAPPDRRIVYLLPLYTGLRRSEAAALRWSDLHLDTANPCVEVVATVAKSGEHETVPLVPELAEGLRAYRDDAGEHGMVFESIPSMEEFRADLDAAKIEHQDARGRKVVLHSLRHSLATMLAAAGIAPAIAQRIMRHRDIRLTMQIYTDESLLPLAAAMNALPRITPEPARRPGPAVKAS